MQNRDATIVDRLSAHAVQWPDRVLYTFVRDDGGVDSITFGELKARVDRLASTLLANAEVGDRAVLLYASGLEFIVSFLSCLRAGVVAVPATVPQKPRAVVRLLNIVRDCAPELVLATEDIATAISAMELDELRSRQLIATDRPLEGGAGSFAPPPITPADIAFLQYTSGSTGDPKGVIVSHEALIANEQAIQASFEHSQESVHVGWLPLFHDMGLVGNVLQPLYVGYHSVLMSPQSFLRQPVKWLAAITDYGGTTSGAPNFAYDHCARLVTSEQKQSLDLRTWRVAFNGAETVRADTLDRFAAAFADCGFRREAFFPCYGMAESVLLISGGPPLQPTRLETVSADALERNEIRPMDHDGSDTRTIVGCGAAHTDTVVEIVEPTSSISTPPGRVGEIWISSPSVAKGYWRRENETEAIFRAKLLGDNSGRFLRTGDLGFIKDGALFVTGRLKDVIIIHGRNLYPHDIEAAVEQAATFVRPNRCAAFSLNIGGDERLAVVVETDRDWLNSHQALSRTAAASSALVNAEARTKSDWQVSDAPTAALDRIRQILCDEWEVPVHVVAVVAPGHFPMTSSGKVQRSACRDGLLQGTLEVLYSSGDLPRQDSASDCASKIVYAGCQETRKAECNHGSLRPTLIAARPVTDYVTIASYEPQSVSASLPWVTAAIVDHLREEGRDIGQDLDVSSSVRELGIDSLGLSSIAVRISNNLGKQVTQEQLYEAESILDFATFVDSLKLSDGVGAPRRNRHGFERLPNIIAADAGARCATNRLRYARMNDRTNRFRANGRYYFGSEVATQTSTTVTVAGSRLLMLGSYEYLGLLGHPHLRERMIQAIEVFGTGHHGVRLLAGTTTLHRELELYLARILHAEDALVYGSGFVANTATIKALVGEGDCAIGDEWNHASIAEGCRDSGATFLKFTHNEMSSLEQRLQEAGARHTLVVVDAVFSMDGDIINLPAVVELCRKYNAMLMVDEAHSLGVLGRTGLGVQEHFGLSPDAIDIKMGTLSKALASTGGYVAAKSDIIEYLRHHAGGYVFSGALPAPQVAAALAALEVLSAEPQRVARLWKNVERYQRGLSELGFDTYSSCTPILPIATQFEDLTLEMVHLCRGRGLFAVPVFYPAVPMNAPRLRTCVSAAHSDADIDFALEVLGQAGRQTGLLN